MSWLKMTSEALYLMKGGTNEFLKKVDLAPFGDPVKQEFEFTVPKDWFAGSDVPGVIVVDVGSTEQVKQSTASFSPDPVFNTVVKRSQWGASDPTSMFEVVSRPKHIVIHHTEGTPSSGGLTKAKEVVKGIQADHMDPTNPRTGWSDIGYNFLNMVDGILVEGRSGSLAEAIRGNVVRGAHAGTDEGNACPGVSNEGNFMTSTMNSFQWDSLVNMCAALCESCHIDPMGETDGKGNIAGHRDFLKPKETDCPGDWLYGQLDELRKQVAAKLAS